MLIEGNAFMIGNCFVLNHFEPATFAIQSFRNWHSLNIHKRGKKIYTVEDAVHLLAGWCWDSIPFSSLGRLDYHRNPEDRFQGQMMMEINFLFAEQFSR